MKLVGMILVAGVVLLFASVSFATPIDPSIVFGGGGSCGTTLMETATTQSFTVLTATSPACAGTNGYVDFKNEIAGGTFDIPFLIVTVTSPFDGSVSCSISLTQPQTFFNNAMPTATNACTFTQIAVVLTSVPGGSTYGLQFGGLSPFTGGTTLDTLNITLSTVPEPATLLLLGTGLCGVAALRKRLKGFKTTT